MKFYKLKNIYLFLFIILCFSIICINITEPLNCKNENIKFEFKFKHSYDYNNNIEKIKLISNSGFTEIDLNDVTIQKLNNRYFNITIDTNIICNKYPDLQEGIKGIELKMKNFLAFKIDLTIDDIKVNGRKKRKKMKFILNDAIPIKKKTDYSSSVDLGIRSV